VAFRGNNFSVPNKYFVSKPTVKGLHGGGMGGHPRDEAKGMDVAVSGLLQGEAVVTRFTKPQQKAHLKQESIPVPVPQSECVNGALPARGKPRSRVEQALQATDLLLQGGGFAAIVLDMGGLTADHVSRIPLATWFRYRAAAERTQSSVVLLTQYACAKSSAELVLRLETGRVSTHGGTVLTAFERGIEVSRRRFVEEEKVVTIRKQPQRALGMTWKTEMAWAGRGQR
jgi:recombination protein RecA